MHLPDEALEHLAPHLKTMTVQDIATFVATMSRLYAHSLGLCSADAACERFAGDVFTASTETRDETVAAALRLVSEVLMADEVRL